MDELPTIADLKEKLVKASSQLDTVNKDLADKSKQLDQMQLAAKEEEEKLDADAAAMGRLNAEIQEKIAATKAQLASYNASDNALKQQEGAYSDAIKDYTTKAQAYQAEAESFEATWKNYQDSLAAGGDPDPQIEETAEEIMAEEEELKQLEQTLIAKKQPLQDARAVLDKEFETTLKAPLEDIKAGNNQLEADAARLNAESQSLDRAKQQLSSLQDARKAVLDQKTQLEVLIDQLSKSIPAREQKDNFDVQAGVLLTDALKAVIRPVANAYLEKTKKRLVISSGIRTPEKQAREMYKKIIQKVDVVKMYHNKTAAAEIKKTYDENKTAGKDAIIAAMAKAIATQMTNKSYISRHLYGGGFDISILDMRSADKSALDAVLDENRNIVLYDDEEPGTPKHYHIASSVNSNNSLSLLSPRMRPLNFLTENSNNVDESPLEYPAAPSGERPGL